tara:strand:- start:1 stop:531 length:531 start_codon:yes stop_codon:yes gene_type:complete
MLNPSVGRHSSLAELRAELAATEQRLRQVTDEAADMESGGSSDAHMPPVELGSFSMLLLKWNESANPTCWRTHQPIVRSLEECRLRLQKLRDKVLAPSDFNVKQPAKPKEVKRRFAENAKQHSDHAASARGGGDLGVVMSGTLDPHLEHTARTLAPGAVSDEIQTPQGLHLLMRQP